MDLTEDQRRYVSEIFAQRKNDLNLEKAAMIAKIKKKTDKLRTPGQQLTLYITNKEKRDIKEIVLSYEKQLIELDEIKHKILA